MGDDLNNEFSDVWEAIKKAFQWQTMDANGSGNKLLKHLADQAACDGAKENQLTFLFAGIFSSIHQQDRSQQWTLRCLTEAYDRTDIVIECNANPSRRIYVETKTLGFAGPKNEADFLSDFEKVSRRIKNNNDEHSIGLLIWWGTLWTSCAIKAFRGCGRIAAIQKHHFGGAKNSKNYRWKDFKDLINEHDGEDYQKRKINCHIQKLLDSAREKGYAVTPVCKEFQDIDPFLTGQFSRVLPYAIWVTAK